MSTDSVSTSVPTFTAALTTDLPEHSDTGISITLVVILTVVPMTLLLSSGCIACYIVKRRRKTKQRNVQGHENRSIRDDTGRISGNSAAEGTTETRESGAYKSLDAIAVDLNDIHKRRDHSAEKVANERQSKESSKSGAYMSFDDLEHGIPDMRMSIDDFAGVSNRISSYYDFSVPEVAEVTLSDAENRQADRRSVHNLINESRPNSRTSFGKKYNSYKKSRESGISENTCIEVFNPAFSRTELSDSINRTSGSSTREKLTPACKTKTENLPVCD